MLRFSNGPDLAANGLHWDIDELYRLILSGLRTALHHDDNIRSVGVDSWAVDYALIAGCCCLQSLRSLCETGASQQTRPRELAYDDGRQSRIAT